MLAKWTPCNLWLRVFHDTFVALLLFELAPRTLPWLRCGIFVRVVEDAASVSCHWWFKPQTCDHWIALDLCEEMFWISSGCGFKCQSFTPKTFDLHIVELSSSRFAVKRFRGGPSPSLYSCGRSPRMQEILGTRSTGQNSLLQVHLENSSLETNCDQVLCQRCLI